ncbi:MAG: xylulokinase [Pirellulales bacterium]
MGVFLGIDIGTSGTKTLAIDESGAILSSAMAEYPIYHPKPLWSEQDPEDWWQATVKTVRQVVKQAKLKKADVKAIGLSGQMHGSVFLDKNDKVIRRALLWNDQRTAAECKEIEQRAGGRAALIKLVANPALTGFTAPKILWLRNNEPKHFDRLKKVLLPKDDVRRRLTGEYATEVSDASGMLLLDVARRDWSTKLLSKLELDRELFGTCHESEDVTGRLTSEAAAALGLSTDCVVVGGAGDCAAGAVGNGIVKSGILSTSLGTSGVMFIHSDEVKIDPQGRVHTFCHAVRGKWHMMGVTLAAGGSLQWFRNQLCEDLSAKAKSAKRDPYELICDMAAEAPAGSDGLLFLPYLSGERTPHADPLARGCFIGLTPTHTRGHMARAVMEGVTYSLRESLEIFRGLDVPVKQIRASGGGSRSPFWRQMQADVFGQKVVTLKAEEGPAFGVALLAAVGGGAFKDVPEACAATIQVVSETKTNRREKQVYDAAFEVYRQQYPALQPSFQKIAELVR